MITELGIFLNNDFVVNGFETLSKLFFTTLILDQKALFTNVWFPENWPFEIGATEK